MTVSEKMTLRDRFILGPGEDNHPMNIGCFTKDVSLLLLKLERN